MRAARLAALLAVAAVLAVAAALGAPPAANGAAFRSPPQPATVGAATSSCPPRLAVDAAGNAIAVWTDQTAADLDWAYRPAGGAWQAQAPIDTAEAPNCNFIRAATDAAGNATVVWSTSANLIRSAYKPAASTTWTKTTESAAPSNDPSLAVAPNGRAVIAFITNSGRNVFAVYRQPGATSFSALDDELSGGGSGQARNSTSAAILSDGRAVVVWQHFTELDLTSAFRDPGDSTFDAEVDIVQPGMGVANVFDPIVSADGIGKAHVSYVQRTTGGNRTVRATSLAAAGGTMWESTTGLSASMSDATVEHQIAAAPNGAVHAAWQTTGGELRYSHRSTAGSWSPVPGLLVAGTTPAVGDFALAADRATNGAVVAWSTTSGGPEVRARNITAAGALQGPLASVVSAQGEGPTGPSVALDPFGNGVIGWVGLNANPDQIRAELTDAQPPVATIAGPTGLVAGEQGEYSVAGSDFSGLLTPVFDFGDGVLATGNPVFHRFATAGDFTVSATVSDGFDRKVTRTLGVGVAPPPPGPPPPPPPPVSPPPQDPDCCARPSARLQPPDTTVTSPGRRVKARRLKAISGTASDQLGLDRVEVAVLRLRGRARLKATASAVRRRGRCQALGPAGLLRPLRIRSGRCGAPRFLRASGTTSWRYTLRRRLPPGKYVVVARAVAADGTVEPGYGPADGNLVRFRVVR